MSDPSMDRPFNQCKAHRKNGERCKRPASHGTSVCASHGARAPQVRRKAQQRILEASDKAAARLVQMMQDEDVPYNVQLAAARDLLDRANIVGTQQVNIDIGTKPDWEQRLVDAGVFKQVQIDWNSVGAEDDVVDAEVVETPAGHTASLKAAAYAAETGPRPALKPLKPRRAPKQPEPTDDPDFYDPSPLASRAKRGPKP